MSLDPVTEIISHFSGFFSLAVEQARMREQYEEFQAGRSQVQDQSELLNISVKVHAKYNFNEFVPRLEYTPTFENVDPLYVSSFVDYNPIPTNVYFDVAYPFFVAQAPMIFVGGMQLSYIFPEPPFPGSLAFVLKQTNVLLDNDFIDMTGLYSGFQPNPDDENQLEYLKDQAELLAPISPLDEPNSEEAIASLIEQVAAEIQSYNSNYQAQDGASASFGVDVFGAHVNGDTTIEAPTLSDKMPDSLKSEEVESAEDDQMHLPDQVYGSGAIQDQPQVELTAGENQLINQVVISSTWSAAAVVAVDGDVHTVNAISQINVWNDTDSIGGLFSNNGSASTATQAYNIASVSVTANPRIDYADIADAEEIIFPVAWNVVRLDANLVFLNSVEQINFVSDHDFHALTSTKDETLVVTGENIAINSLTMLDIMAGYDLIVVGGNYYNANIIIQTNILLDNDTFHTIGASYPGGYDDSDISSDGNLLWNQASIHSIGSTNYEAMSEEFQSLADGLAAGSDFISDAILENSLFSGLPGLSVLYIDGDIYDLQYISQTNILGDNDVINVLASGITEQADASWELSSGENALINVAEIIDVGPDATVLVGGEHYSDALIHQAELVPEVPITQDDGGLVSEAVVFLVDDMLETEQVAGENVPPHVGQTAPDTDLMQTMLS